MLDEHVIYHKNYLIVSLAVIQARKAKCHFLDNYEEESLKVDPSRSSREVSRWNCTNTL